MLKSTLRTAFVATARAALKALLPALAVAGAAGASDDQKFIPAGTRLNVQLITGYTGLFVGRDSVHLFPTTLAITEAPLLSGGAGAGLEKCFLAGTASSDFVTQRAVFSIDKLICPSPTGGQDAATVAVAGFAIDDDKVAGVRGEITPVTRYEVPGLELSVPPGRQFQIVMRSGFTR